ncbi:protein FAM185A [Pogona vitticeps]
MIALWPRCWQLAAGRGHRLLKGGGQVCQQQVSLFVRSSSGGRSDPAQPEGSKLKSSRSVKEWSLTVSPFGLLKVQLPCHMTLCPLDPHKYPDADRVFVTARGANNSSSLDRFHVHYDEVLKEVMILSDDVDSATSVDVKIPVKFDLDIKMSRNGCVKVEKIECDRCRIEAEKGASVLQSVKSQKIDIKAKGGKVICLGTLQGNADIHVSQGSSVNIEKLQGSSINISTKNGLIKMKYLYAESSFLSSTAGDILLGNVHGETTLQTTTGNIEVDSAEGSLKASTYQGEIDAYVVGQAGEIDLKSQEGSVVVKVPATLNTYLRLSGSKVDVSPEIRLQDVQKVVEEGNIIVTGHLNQKDEKGKCIKAETQNGTIKLKTQTWFQSVKLKTT